MRVIDLFVYRLRRVTPSLLDLDQLQSPNSNPRPRPRVHPTARVRFNATNESYDCVSLVFALYKRLVLLNGIPTVITTVFELIGPYNYPFHSVLLLQVHTNYCTTFASRFPRTQPTACYPHLHVTRAEFDPN